MSASIFETTKLPLTDQEVQKRMDTLTEMYKKLCIELDVEVDEEELREPALRLQQRLSPRKVRHGKA